MITIRNGNDFNFAGVDLSAWIPGRDDPYPTSRVLDGSADHGWSQEWAQDGAVRVQGGQFEARMIWLFDDDDIDDDKEPDAYPWDDRIARIEIDA